MRWRRLPRGSVRVRVDVAISVDVLEAGGRFEWSAAACARDSVSICNISNCGALTVDSSSHISMGAPHRADQHTRER